MRHSLLRTILIQLFIVITVVNAFAQERRSYTMKEVIEQMINYKGDLFMLENAIIFSSQNPFNDSLKRTVNCRVFLKNCTFTNHNKGYFNNIIFNNIFQIYSNKNTYNLHFKNCQFNSLTILNTNQNDYCSISNCAFNWGLQYYGNSSSLYIYNCNFSFRDLEHKGLKNDRGVSLFFEKNCRLSIRNSNFFSEFDVDNIGINGYEQLTNLRIDNSNFNIPVSISNLKIERCKINNTKFYNQLKLSKLTFNKILDFFGTSFESKILLNEITYPPGFDIDWHSIQGNKIALSRVDPTTGDEISPFNALSEDQLTDTIPSNKHNFKKLIRTYRIFIDNYKDWGDLESVNGCYVEMKDIQTRMMGQQYRQDPTLSNYFNWKLNVFLRYFCDYGTSPEKAIIFSFWTILLFSCVYFFFYSEWDGIDRAFLIAQYRKLSNYFTTQQKIDEFYAIEHKKEHQSYTAFRDELRENKTKVPLFFHILGKPLYGLSMLRYSFMKWFYRRFEVIQGRWIDLSASKKVINGSKIAIALILYIVYLIGLKALNAVILSINAFSTLGFGNIPVKRSTRYFTIIEGFIGWFLLSIFSVSLISQIMQI